LQTEITAFVFHITLQYILGYIMFKSMTLKSAKEGFTASANAIA